MRLRPGLAVLLLLALVAAFAPSLAEAHGGLPVSQSIIRRGDQLVVPTRYWGIFLARDPAAGGGPWRWICEEAVNKNTERQWALTGNGTYYATDYRGITSSRDGGCTWIAATGEIAVRATSGLRADPVDARRAWAATDEGKDVPWNALFVTSDDGVSWSPTLQADEYLKGPALSADGQTLYVTGVSRSAGAPVVRLHLSRDGGKSWNAAPLSFSTDGAAQTSLEPLAVDPREAGTLWLAVRGGSRQILVKATGFGAQLVEQFRLPASIGGVGFDLRRDAVLVPVSPIEGATLQGGLMRSVGGGAFAPFSNLSRAQCVLADGEVIYACSWNYLPDNQAVARSDDGGARFSKVFQYADTAGPKLDCPAATPVSQICPAVWRMYAPQLGIDPGGAGGADAGTTTPPGSSCAVVPAGRAASSGRGLMPLPLLLLLLLLMMLLMLRMVPKLIGQILRSGSRRTSR